MTIAFFTIIILIIVVAVASEITRRKRIASSTAVEAGREYPNNYHVLGVGYYHAASKLWFPFAWNEYREGRGYYWDGNWSAIPDLRLVLKSTPSTEEVERVNQAWRKADPDRSQQFWNAVERDGFGIAIRRSEGS